MTGLTAPANVTFVRRGFERQVNYVELAPTSPLAADIEYFWSVGLVEPLRAPWVTSSPGKGTVDLVIPIEGHFCQNAEQHLFGTDRLGAYLVGPLSQPAQIVSTGRCSAMGVRFRPGRSRSFFGFPTSEIRDTCLSVASANQKLARAVSDEVISHASFEARVRVLAEVLLTSRTTQRPQWVVHRAVEMINDGHGQVSVDTLATTLHASARHLERLFREFVGVSPKQLGRMVRVRRAASLITHGEIRFGEVAQTCGYFDQAHFIREFRAVTGLSPSQFVGRRKSPCTSTP